VKGKKMVVIASRGGEYSTEELRPFDFQEPYLRTVFGFVGLTDITFVVAQPMDAGGPDVQKQNIEEAQKRAREVAEGFS
jgi:FMN-dependent NADH-azoreductase